MARKHVLLGIIISIILLFGSYSQQSVMANTNIRAIQVSQEYVFEADYQLLINDTSVPINTIFWQVPAFNYSVSYKELNNPSLQQEAFTLINITIKTMSTARNMIIWLLCYYITLKV